MGEAEFYDLVSEDLMEGMTDGHTACFIDVDEQDFSARDEKGHGGKYS